MCGIVGFVSSGPVIDGLIQGLKKVEYRGYDSAGVAIIEQGIIKRHRAVGPLAALMTELPPFQGTVGIGHTRWATHGRAEEKNAHPHCGKGTAVVHNGIIENFQALKKDLSFQGIQFESDTDTEVIAHLFATSEHLTNLQERVLFVLKQLKGNFAIAVLLQDCTDGIIVARKGLSPLAVGQGKEGFYVGSDLSSLSGSAQKVAFLEDETWGVLYKDQAIFYDWTGQEKNLNFYPNPLQAQETEKGDFQHFMLKEIYQQADLVRSQDLPALPAEVCQASFFTALGCGTAFYAAWVGKFFLERLAKRFLNLELASEFHYRNPILPDGVSIVVSQSGETADTLKATLYAKSQQQYVLGMINAPHSSISRQVDYLMPTGAGTEIGVASTKAFTMQVLSFLNLSLALCSDAPLRQTVLDSLKEIPSVLKDIIQRSHEFAQIAAVLSQYQSILYLGRGLHYPLALEGALKMSELSYIHAQGFAAGELKHGPLALIDPQHPVVVLAPWDESFSKTLSNLHEVKARNGPIFLITDTKGAASLEGLKPEGLFMYPSLQEPLLQVFPNAICVQLLAYYTALHKGLSIDQPRNLSKSVTVE